MYIRRKVFSNAGYGYEPVEDVYNVTMTGDEVRLFSELQERMYAKNPAPASAPTLNIDLGQYMDKKGKLTAEGREVLDRYVDSKAKQGVNLSRKMVLDDLIDQYKKAGLSEKEAKALAEKKVQAGLDSAASPNFLTRAKNGIKEGYNKSIGWVKKNPKLAAAAGIGTLGIGGGAYYLGSRD